MNRLSTGVAAGIVAVGVVGALLASGRTARGREQRPEGRGQRVDGREHRATGRTPVIVELFTSEGCSSCPSADQALLQLQQAQPITGAMVIPMSEHVDYWNYIGWRDPYSSPSLSDRQRSYASAFRLDGVYTPQMIVDGRAEFVGSDRGRARASIEAAAAAPHARVVVRAAPVNEGTLDVEVRVENLVRPAPGDADDVYLALTEDRLSSNVGRGENAGRKLAHTAVVRQMRRLGTASAGATFTTHAVIEIPTWWKRADMSAVVFVQERASRRITGAARASLAGQ